MIEIKITDPQHEPARVLRAIALALNSIAADKEGPMVENTVSVTVGGAVRARSGDFDKLVGELKAEGSLAAAVQAETPFPVAPGLIADEEVPPPPKHTLAEDAPPPAPALATDAPPPAAPSSDVAQVVLDKAGLPWDDRIHSSSKALNQTDGLWRARRGVADDVVTRVTAELRELMAIPAADAPPAPPAPPAPADAPPAPPAPTGVPSGFIELMPLVTAAVSAKRITAEEFAEAWKATGVPALTGLMARPDLAQAVYYALADRL